MSDCIRASLKQHVLFEELLDFLTSQRFLRVFFYKQCIYKKLGTKLSCMCITALSTLISIFNIEMLFAV